MYTNIKAMAAQGMMIDITTVYLSKEFFLKNVLGSVWLALQNRNYFLLAVYVRANSLWTKPVRTSCQDAHHFNVENVSDRCSSKSPVPSTHFPSCALPIDKSQSRFV